MPGHVRASMNWNQLRKAYKDNYSLPIQDGQKVIVCKLRSNPMGYTSIAYPIDELQLPEWFKNLPFSHKEMEQTIIDQKIKNLIGVLGWELEETQEQMYSIQYLQLAKKHLTNRYKIYIISIMNKENIL